MDAPLHPTQFGQALVYTIKAHRRPFRTASNSLDFTEYIRRPGPVPLR